MLRREGVTLQISLAQRSVVRGLSSHLPANYFHYPAVLTKINKSCRPITVFLENVEVRSAKV